MERLTALQLFRSEFIALPRAVAGKGARSFLGSLFDEYQSALDRLSGDPGRAFEAKRSAMALLCTSILNTLETFDDATIEPMVAVLSKGIDAVREDLLHVARRNDETVLKGQSLYRLRRSDTRLSLRRDLFHVPFSIRHLTPHLRYSVSGSPCLYLANSIYTCWNECRFPGVAKCSRAELREIYAARFELAPGAQVLDLCYLPQAIEMALAHYEDPRMLELGLGELGAANAPFGADADERARYLASYLTIWPLLAATSLRVPGEAARVRPEYIVPQVLMAWVQASSDFAGVRYFSTREEASFSNHDYAIDYAFPAKSAGSGGYCDFLRAVILCTRPLSFGDIEDLDVAKIGHEEFLLAEAKSRRYMIVDDAGMWHYFGTPYCNMEYVLDKLLAEPIEEPTATAP